MTDDLVIEELRLAELVVALRQGRRVTDRTFDDALYPHMVRTRSLTFWTPVAVALRATAILVEAGVKRVLDVGSGVGKFCIVGAAATDLRFVGVEHREHLVRIAIDAASRARALNARFVHGDFACVDVRRFDAIYLFNPFEENAWPPVDWLDDTVPLSFAKGCEDVERTEALLHGAPAGTHVVTYHGFGGDIPASYARVLSEPCHTGQIELWTKR